MRDMIPELDRLRKNVETALTVEQAKPAPDLGKLHRLQQTREMVDTTLSRNASSGLRVGR